VTDQFFGSLLDDVRKLVSDQRPAFTRLRPKTPCRKHHVAADRIRERVHLTRGVHGARVSMNPYFAEVVAEARLKVGASRCFKRLAGGAQYLVDDWWNRSALARVAQALAHQRRVAFAVLAFAIRVGGGASAFALQQPRLRFGARRTLASHDLQALRSAHAPLSSLRFAGSDDDWLRGAI